MGLHLHFDGFRLLGLCFLVDFPDLRDFASFAVLSLDFEDLPDLGDSDDFVELFFDFKDLGDSDDFVALFFDFEKTIGKIKITKRRSAKILRFIL